jgi:hypothetical protein
MLDPRTVAERLLGAVEWQSEVIWVLSVSGGKTAYEQQWQEGLPSECGRGASDFLFPCFVRAGGGGGQPQLASGTECRSLGATAARWAELRSGDLLQCRVENGARRMEIVGPETGDFARRCGDAEENWERGKVTDGVEPVPTRMGRRPPPEQNNRCFIIQFVNHAPVRRSRVSE